MNDLDWRFRLALDAPNYPDSVQVNLAGDGADLEAAIASGALEAAFTRAGVPFDMVEVSKVRNHFTRRKLAGVLGKELWNDFELTARGLMVMKPPRQLSRVDFESVSLHRLGVYKYLLTYFIELWTEIVSLWLMQNQQRADVRELARVLDMSGQFIGRPVSPLTFFDSRGQVGMKDVMQVIEVIPHVFQAHMGREITQVEFGQLLTDASFFQILTALSVSYASHIDPLLQAMRTRNPSLNVTTLNPNFFLVKPKKSGGCSIRFSAEVQQFLDDLRPHGEETAGIHTGCPMAHHKNDEGHLVTNAVARWLAQEMVKRYLPLFPKKL